MVILLLLLRHILHQPGTIPMPSAGWVALLALSSVIGFFADGFWRAHRPQVRAALEVRTALATAADRREAYAYGQRNSV
jgi:hypothetical protein